MKTPWSEMRDILVATLGSTSGSSEPREPVPDAIRNASSHEALLEAVDTTIQTTPVEHRMGWYEMALLTVVIMRAWAWLERLSAKIEEDTATEKLRDEDGRLARTMTFATALRDEERGQTEDAERGFLRLAEENRGLISHASYTKLGLFAHHENQTERALGYLQKSLEVDSDLYLSAAGYSHSLLEALTPASEKDARVVQYQEAVQAKGRSWSVW